MPEEKVIRQYLVVDWSQETTRTRKSKPDNLGKYELLTEIEVEVNLPDEPDVPTLSAEIDVPEAQIYSATLEALDDEDLPDWSQEAEGVVQDSLEETVELSEQELESLVHEMTSKVLIQANSRPKPERVAEYVEQLARQMVGVGQ